MSYKTKQKATNLAHNYKATKHSMRAIEAQVNPLDPASVTPKMIRETIGDATADHYMALRQLIRDIDDAVKRMRDFQSRAIFRENIK